MLPRTNPQVTTWKPRLVEHAIVPIQQFANSVGKNATDSTMIIDAMDLLHSCRYDTFVLVTSDADFTRLATRIREDGKTVIGIGRDQTPRAFVQACNTFISVEMLLTEGDAKKPSAAPSRLSASKRKQVLAALATVVNETADDTGWSPLPLIGSAMRRRDPAFDPRAYGQASASLSKFFKSLSNDYEYTLRRSQALVRPKTKDSADS